MKKALRYGFTCATAFTLTFITATANNGGGFNRPGRPGGGDPMSLPSGSHREFKPFVDEPRISTPRGFDPGRGLGQEPGGGTAPLDGGISLLLAAGVGLGVKKARARHKALAAKAVPQEQADVAPLSIQ